MTRPYVRACAVLLFLLAAGCSALGPKIEPPRLSIVRVAMTSADIFNQKFLVRLTVQNPNDRELPIRGIDYQLFLEGDSFAEGVSSKPFIIPALGETEFDMVVQTNFVSGVGRLLSRLNGRDQVQYVFEGKVLTEQGLIKKIRFQESGTVSLGILK
ncbi:MAG TPA: LEA type 2 family protein [Steroidobacter sp.]|jgi:LEA14-like dessication related protein|nr:LEA type 2 family protein [Steroidobacter sp.]